MKRKDRNLKIRYVSDLCYDATASPLYDVSVLFASLYMLC
jgi:hypothetical protein